MTRRNGVILAVIAIAIIVPIIRPRVWFVLGGAFVNAGFRLQDALHGYDFKPGETTPKDVWSEFKHQNELASGVRRLFPRTAEHPMVALLVCMDARIDTSELAGDTRRYYYVVRTAGSVLQEQEEEMLELAVRNGVKVLVLTTHTDCAAEKAAADPKARELFPVLTKAVDDREKRLAEFMARPAIAERVASGELLVKRLVIDTTTGHLSTSSADE